MEEPRLDDGHRGGRSRRPCRRRSARTACSPAPASSPRSGPPEAWVAGLPSLPAARRGQLIALNGRPPPMSPATASSTSRTTPARNGAAPPGPPGARGTRWASGDRGTTTGSTSPSATTAAALRLAWFDRRRPSEEKILLTRLAEAGDWVRLDEAPGEVQDEKRRAPARHPGPRPQGEPRLLLSGCAATAEGSGLVLRVFDGKAMSAAKFLPLRSPS